MARELNTQAPIHLYGADAHRMGSLDAIFRNVICAARDAVDSVILSVNGIGPGHSLWGAGMTRHFGIAAGIVGALVTIGTLVLSLAVWGSGAAVASSGTDTSGVANACDPGPFADCAGADLAGANLLHRNLSHADFAYADLSGADLGWANLTGANLRGADLGDADMMGANLKRADLSGANFMGADLSGAVNSNLDSASAASTQYVVCHTILPSGHLPKQDC